MQESMLEMLAQQCCCYISSLPARADSLALIRLLRGLDMQKYSLREWGYCLSYIYREEIAFDSYDELDALLSRKDRQAKR